jgi:hypothetical protein
LSKGNGEQNENSVLKVSSKELQIRFRFGGITDKVFRLNAEKPSGNRPDPLKLIKSFRVCLRFLRKALALEKESVDLPWDHGDRFRGNGHRRRGPSARRRVTDFRGVENFEVEWSFHSKCFFDFVDDREETFCRVFGKPDIKRNRKLDLDACGDGVRRENQLKTTESFEWDS